MTCCVITGWMFPPKHHHQWCCRYMLLIINSEGCFDWITQSSNKHFLLCEIISRISIIGNIIIKLDWFGCKTSFQRCDVRRIVNLMPWLNPSVIKQLKHDFEVEYIDCIDFPQTERICKMSYLNKLFLWIQLILHLLIHLLC